MLQHTSATTASSDPLSWADDEVYGTKSPRGYPFPPMFLSTASIPASSLWFVTCIIIISSSSIVITFINIHHHHHHHHRYRSKAKLTGIFLKGRSKQGKVSKERGFFLMPLSNREERHFKRCLVCPIKAQSLLHSTFCVFWIVIIVSASWRQI